MKRDMAAWTISKGESVKKLLFLQRTKDILIGVFIYVRIELSNQGGRNGLQMLQF